MQAVQWIDANHRVPNDKDNLIYLDDATGLFNTRYLRHCLQNEVTRAKRTEVSFGVLFIDVDHFKRINDEYGHIVGTRVLNEVGSQFKKEVRAQDSVCRYGGDEFIIVLSSCTAKAVTQVAERIRSSIAETTFLAGTGHNIHLTVSIGIALCPDHADSPESLLQSSDLALYQAKKANRNQIWMAEPTSHEPRKAVIHPLSNGT